MRFDRDSNAKGIAAMVRRDVGLYANGHKH